jgi:hypothetical protein
MCPYRLLCVQVTGRAGLSDQDYPDVRCNYFGLVITNKNRPCIRSVPCTPPTDNSCKRPLFGVIGDIWAKGIYHPPIVVIRALHNVGPGHERFEGTEDHPQQFMHMLMPEHVELQTFPVLSCAWMAVSERLEYLTTDEMLFGIAKKPIGTRVSRWARRVEFLMFPGEK